MKRLLILITLLFVIRIVLTGQPIPGTDENIPFLVTFGNEAPKSCGDNDNIQSVFVIIPESINEEFYMRIFDPDIGGEFDDIIDKPNTSTTFAIYGSYNILPGDTCNEEPIFHNEF